LAAVAQDEGLMGELERYGEELVAWGGSRPLDRWLGVVERAHAVSSQVRPGDSRLVRTVAASLYKLIAYKDEYEVARLMLDAEGTAAAFELAERGGRIAWKLHPPILRALGVRRKISIGLGAAPLIRLLASSRFLRGTPLDPFGWAEVRRVERVLPAEFEAVLDRALDHLDDGNFETVLELAGLPDQIRGYEELKLERVARYREAMAELDAALSS